MLAYILYTEVAVLLTPSQCQIEEDPLLIVCSKHFHQKEADEYSFTQCPGEGGQEEVVHEGCHNLAGSLVKRSEEQTSSYGTCHSKVSAECPHERPLLYIRYARARTC